MSGSKVRSTANAFKFQTLSLILRLIPCTFLALLLCLYFCPDLYNTLSLQPHQHPHPSYITYLSSLSAPPPTYSGVLLVEKDIAPLPSPPPYSEKEENKAYKKQCDYFNGNWVPDKTSPLYNGTTCGGTIQKGQNCMVNGRPDSDYIYWRWKPRRCHLPRFEPETFLQLIKNKHVAFVGDSIARNQLESLICMLSSASTPTYVHRGVGWWHFPSHNATLSSYWAPFLVKGVQRQVIGPQHNTMYLDQVDESWAKDMDQMDLIVLSFGNWFVISSSVFYEGGSVLGCRDFPDLNCTDIGFYDPIRKALRTALNSIIERKIVQGNEVSVIVRPYSPSHVDCGNLDKGSTYSMTKPYKKGEKKLEEWHSHIRRIEMEELKIAKAKVKQFGGFRFDALDVTKLALTRPDGHPGAYLNPFPFAKGISKIVQSDCSHWCLPGPIDTWNEIFLEIMKKWEEQPSSE